MGVALLPVLLWSLCIIYAAGHERKHHLYRPGHAPDSCVSGSMSTKYWTGATNSTGKALIGTTYALDTIDALQHPKDCRARNFLLWVPVHHGVGSNIHCLGQALAHALSLNRVLILLKDEEHPYYDTQYCNPEENYHDCYFEALTSCTIDDARTAAGHQLDDLNGVPEISYETTDVAENHSQSKVRVIKLSGISRNEKQVPRPLSLFLSSSTLRPEKHFYWWRAVSTAYIMRPNVRTLKAIEDRKGEIYPEMSVGSGTVAVHVRHGDKWQESKPVDDQQYVTVLEELSLQESDQWALSQSIYLSTEDAATVDFFKGLPDWNVTFTRVKRYTDKNKSPMGWAAEVGRSSEMLNSLTSLDLSLQCDAFVMTLSSNWCRLIDELRATVRCKADHPFLDAQQADARGDYNVEWR